MDRESTSELTETDVVIRIRTELELGSPGISPLERRMSRIRSLQRKFREQPLGGRLLPIKRVIHWFTASAFDRQAKVVEALIEVVQDLELENRYLSAELGRRSESGDGGECTGETED